MSITSEISRIQTNIADAYTAAEAKGATMPVTENSDNLATTIESISTGIEPTGSITLTNNGTYNVTNYATAIVDNPNVLKHWCNWKTDDVLSDTESTLSNSNNWKYIVKGADKYILISSAQSDVAKISSDAINWENLTLPANTRYRSICYGNGVYLLFPLEGGEGYYYSIDGINWELKSSITSNNILGSSFLNNKFFAYIGGGSIAISDDGLNWSIHALSNPYNTNILDLAYGNGVFVGVPDGGRNFVEVSMDGINWTMYSGIASISGPRISFGNGVFVITYGYGTNSTNWFSYSTDGINWRNDQFAVSDSWNKAYFCNGNFIVYGGTLYSNSSKYLISSDGSNWIQKSFQHSRTKGDAVCVDDALIIAPWYNSTYITYLSISNLTAYTLDEVPTTSSVVYSAPNTQSSLIITTGSSTQITLSDANVYYRNGAADIQEHLPIGSTTITENGTYDITDYAEAVVNVSDVPAVVESLSITPSTSQQIFIPASGIDGYTPVTISAVDSTIDQNIVAGNIKRDVTILGVTGTYTGESPVLNTLNVTPTTSVQTITPTTGVDGYNEVLVSAVTSAIDPDITSENIVEGVNILGITGTAKTTTLSVTTPRLVVVNNGTDGVAYSDNGGNTWSESQMPVTAEWRSIAFGNGRYVAIVETSNTTIGAYSDDGINWTESEMPSGKYYDVCYGSGKFVAIIRGSNTFAYSTDGENWISVTVPVSKNWYQIAYGNGKFIAVSSSNSTFVYSEDGINWIESTDTVGGHIMFGGNKFISGNVQSIKYSSDGINWTDATLPTLPSSAEEANIYNVVYDGTVYLAVCLGHSNTGYLTLISSDGATWSFTSSTTAYLSETYNTAYNLKNVKYDGKNFVGLTRNGQYTFIAESDGLWTVTENNPVLTGTDWNGLCYGEPVTSTTTVDDMLNMINGE